LFIRPLATFSVRLYIR